jgi:hypothetical protein
LPEVRRMKLDLLDIHRSAVEHRRRQALELEVDRNCRLLELARHNGYELDVRDVPSVGRCWYVPELLVGSVGRMVALVR